MSYLMDETKRQQKTNPEDEQESGDIQKTGDMTPTAGPAPTTAPKVGLSTGMKGTQAQKYVQAHQAPKLAERITGKLQAKEAELSGKLEGAQSNIETQTGFKSVGEGIQEQQVDGKYTGAIGAIKNIQPVAQNIATKTSGDIQAFMKAPEYEQYKAARDFKYKPIEDERVAQLPGQVQELRQTAQKGQTEAGRFGLLRDLFGRKDKEYTQGQQSLDQLLLQQGKGEAAALADYSKTAGADLETKANQLKSLQTQANEAIKREGEQLQSDIAKSATDQFGQIPQDIQARVLEYNKNKTRMNELLVKALSGQEVSPEDQADFQKFMEKNPALKAQLSELQNQAMYNTPFIEQVQYRAVADPNRQARSVTPGESTDLISAYKYGFGGVTPEQIQQLIASQDLNPLQMTDQYKFLTDEDIARQSAIEQLYGREIGQEYNKDIFDQRYRENALTPETLREGEAFNLEGYLKGQKGDGSIDPNDTLGLGYEGRKQAVEKSVRGGALENAVEMQDWFHDTVGRHGGYGASNYGAGAAQDAIANSYRFLSPESLDNPELNSMAPEQMVDYIANDPTTGALFDQWEGDKFRNQAMVENIVPLATPGDYGRDELQPYKVDENYYNLLKNNAKREYAQKIVEKRMKTLDERNAMRGTQFQTLKKLFGSQV